MCLVLQVFGHKLKYWAKFKGLPDLLQFFSFNEVSTVYMTKEK